MERGTSRPFEGLLVSPDGKVHVMLDLDFSPYTTRIDMLSIEKLSFPVYTTEYNMLNMKRELQTFFIMNEGQRIPVWPEKLNPGVRR